VSFRAALSDSRIKNLLPFKAEKGQAVVEMVGNIIIFGIMLCMVSGLSCYLYLQHTLLTAAREGARTGALHAGFGSGDSAGAEAAVKQKVKDFMLATAGQTLVDNDIDVTAPDPADTDGDRSVGVSITYNVANPINVADFIMALSGTDHTGLRTFTLQAAAQMRYEE
jgi:hypothetical protein